MICELNNSSLFSILSDEVLKSGESRIATLPIVTVLGMHWNTPNAMLARHGKGGRFRISDERRGDDQEEGSVPRTQHAGLVHQGHVTGDEM